ncbi:hypothetical protein [Ruminococcus sp.]|uniref:hypothetical protein n=1 Tax=Ruminococcus sp. TaxID=41978 RepID=UPI00258C038E|nr:hypothetical protein [Ruminococcus sp.]MCR5019374.1 hypothetical protein [Ruminococcus sp.]
MLNSIFSNERTDILSTTKTNTENSWEADFRKECLNDGIEPDDIDMAVQAINTMRQRKKKD